MIINHHSAQVRSQAHKGGIVHEAYKGVLTTEACTSLAISAAMHTPDANGILFDKSMAIIAYGDMEGMRPIRKNPPAVAFIVPDSSFLMVADYCQAMAISGLHWTAWLDSQREQAQNWVEAFALLRTK